MPLNLSINWIQSQSKSQQFVVGGGVFGRN